MSSNTRYVHSEKKRTPEQNFGQTGFEEWESLKKVEQKIRSYLAHSLQQEQKQGAADSNSETKKGKYVWETV